MQSFLTILLIAPLGCLGSTIESDVTSCAAWRNDDETNLMQRSLQISGMGGGERLNAPKPKTNSIPRKIYQTYSTPLEYSASGFENCSQHVLKQLNPDWDYQLFFEVDIEHYIKNTYGQTMWSLYSSIHPSYGAARADLFRYLLLYDRGGVYFDAKSLCNHSLSTMLLADDSYILAHSRYMLQRKVENQLGEYINWFIAAAPRHPFLKAVISKVVQNLLALHKESFYNGPFIPQGTTKGAYLRTKRMVLNVTGPAAYTMAIQTVKAPHRNIGFYPDSGFQYECVKHRFANHYSYSHSPLIIPSSTLANVDAAMLTESSLSALV